MRTGIATRITAIAALALFSFVFLGSEFCFDICIEAFVSSADVVWAQNIGLGISAVGFIAFGLFARNASSNHLQALTVLGALAACLCLILVKQASSETVVRIAGYAAFFLLGGGGAAAHWLVAQALANDTALARTVGIAYACGILLQFINNQFVPAGLAETLVLCLGCITLTAIVLTMKAPGETKATDANKSISTARHTTSKPTTAPSPAATMPPCKQPLRSALWTIALVMLLACLFSTLDNVVTIANAQGTVSVERWPRLFLALSGIVAGFLFDIGRRRYMGLAMFCVALLSTCSILATEAGINPLVGLIAFYLGSGCFVVFFTTTFLSLAPNMKMPALWAGMGRAANNICALALSGASLTLVQTANAALTMFATVILFAFISVAMVASGLLTLPESKQNEEKQTDATNADNLNYKAEQPSATLSAAQKLELFANTYNLTPRETEVLQAVSSDDRPLKQIASEMGISLRMLQKHLTSLYQKTDAQTRTGLALKFHKQ